MYRPLEIRIKNFISYEYLVYKFPQRPVLLVGENKDDPAQLRNGSGKSALIEAIPFAILGETLRDAKPKELIRRGCDFAEIEIDLYNKKLGKVLAIKRTLFPKKSSKVEVKFGNQEIRLSSVAEYDAYILRILEISKEDFFSFFVIKKDDYRPFFSTTDSKKKAIINRFSKADIIDKTKPLIDIETLVLTNQVFEKEKKCAYLSGQIALLEEQLAQKSPGKHLEILNSDLIAKKDSLKYCQDRLSTNLLDKKTLLGEISIHNLEIESLNNDIVIAKRFVEVDELEYQNLLAEANETSQRRHDASIVDAITLKRLNGDKVETLEELNNNKIFLSQLTAKIQESIECPSCHHKFCLNDVEFNIEEAKEIISLDLMPLIEACENRVKENQLAIDVFISASKAEVLAFHEGQVEKNNKFAQAFAKRKESILASNNLINSLRGLVTIKNDKEASNERSVTAIDLNKKRTVEIEDAILLLENRIVEIQDQKIDDTDQVKINLLKVDLTTAVSEMELLKQAVINEKVWITHFKNFKSFLANQSIGNIQDYTNMYLEKMGSDLSVELDGYRTLSDNSLKEEISVSVSRSLSGANSYGVFSAGERARVDIACILSIQHLINLSCDTGGLDLLICDEILDAADALGIQKIIESISDSSAIIMIVSQNEVMSSIANIVTATKERGLSSLSYNY